MIWHVFAHYGIVASLIYILVEFLIFQILLELLVFSIDSKHKRVFENNSRIFKYRWLIFTILLFIKLLIFLNIGGSIQIKEFIAEKMKTNELTLVVLRQTCILAAAQLAKRKA